MKSLKKFRFFLIAGIAAVTMTSCLTDQYNEIQNNSMAGFDFKTINNVNVTITALDNSNQPMSNVRVMLYTQNPLNEDGTLKQDNESYLLYTGTTDVTGKILCQIAPATFVDSIKVLVNQIGFPALQTIKITSADMTIQIGGGTAAQNVRAKVGPSKIIAFPTPTQINGYYVLGTWNNNSGIPNYLMANDVISASLLADINTTLPEYKALPTMHPEFFSNPNDGSIKLYEDAEVFVTFVHEGAGWMNMLSYYTYATSNPPATVNDITNKTVIFPNVSFSGSGGGLNSGNKVQLLYLNPVTKTYSNIFPKGTTVSWALQGQGWSGSNIKAVDSKYMWYSDQRFNLETDVLKKHNVLLNDVERHLLLIAFEDQQRPSSDNDFNDAVFYATTNPITAINPDDYKKVIKVNDTDGDGVSDENDDYPNDPKRAHNNYYPAKNLNGTLAFEDLWPSKGDYDFNDMVVDYNYNQITNGKNEVISVDATFTLRAFGASYANGFGVQFNTTPDNIISVSGQKFTTNLLNLNTNGTEKNQSKAVVMIFDNAQDVLKHSGTSVGVNTVVGEQYVTPVSFKVSFELKTPVASSQFGAAPYNPFIFINAERNREVHLAKTNPTDLADLKLFGTHDDDTNLSSGNYYMSNKYLPWAINIPVQFTYPIEKEDITKAYLMFNKWANSKGTLYSDWYLDKSGYRDPTKLYIK